MALALDHLVVAVRDLDAAAARLRAEHGLGSVAGGRHPGRGTANRIVPLGRGYVELVAVVDPCEATRDPFGRLVGAAAARGDGLAAWCLDAGDDLDAVAAARGLRPATWTRESPAGTLAWRLAGLEQAIADPTLPFFIAWDVPPARRPAAAAASHAARPTGVGWVEVGGDSRRLNAWLPELAIPVEIFRRERGLLAAGILSEEGQVVLRRAA